MGIKACFSPMGGTFGRDRGDLSLWRYSNDVIAGKTLLYNYIPQTGISMYGYSVGSSTATTVYYIKNYPPTAGMAIYYANGVDTLDRINSGYSGMNANFFEGTLRYAGDLHEYYRNASTDITGLVWPEPLYVPKAGGRAIINDWYDTTSSGIRDTNRNTPFYNNQNIVNVDLQNVPFRNNSMRYAFNNCPNLKSVSNISSSVVNMLWAFNNCVNLNSRIRIPNSVTDIRSAFINCRNLNQNIELLGYPTSMFNTFYNCRNLNQNIQIPSSVTNMVNTFAYCYNLNQNIQIPSSVMNMYRTFAQCSNLNQNIKIPNSVTNMVGAFSQCYNLNQNIKIPNSVTNMVDTFDYCYNLNQNIQIPNSVTDMCGTFESCYNLNQNIRVPKSCIDLTWAFLECYNMKAWINILSENISAAHIAFNTYTNDSIPNVFIIGRYINNVVTQTYNAMKSAGWKWSDASIVGTAPNRVRCWSLGWSNYSSVYPSGGYYNLNAWHGKMDTFLNNNTAVTDVKVPEYLTIDNDPLNWEYPTRLSRLTFDRNKVLINIDLGTDIPWASNQLGYYTNTKAYNGAFNSCTNLKSIKGVINSTVVNMPIAFYQSYNLKDMDIVFPEGISSLRAGITLGNYNCNMSPLPSTVTNMLYCTFSSTYGAPVIPPSLTTAANGGFRYASNTKGNIYWLSPVTSNIDNSFQGYNASVRRNIFIYTTYSNGVNTSTYNQFKANNVYKGTSGNTVIPMYNSTANFYVYNLSANYYQIYTYSGSTSTTLTKYNDSINVPHMAVFARYPDYKVTGISNTCFSQARNLRTLALYDKPWTSTSLIYAFRNCYNLRVIQGLNLTGITNMYMAFDNCSNLRVMRNIPGSVQDLSYAFSGCTNLNFNIQLKSGIINMSQTFNYCWNLDQHIVIPNTVTNLYRTFSYCPAFRSSVRVLSTEVTNAVGFFYNTLPASYARKVYIPFYYSNGTRTKTLNAFMAADYIDTFMRTGYRDNVEIIDINY